MNKKRFFIHTLIISALLSLSAAAPLAAGTKEELKALKEEIATLQQGQEKMQKDLAEIKTLLEKGAAAAPAKPAFQPKDLVVGNSAYLGSADAPVTMFEYSDYQCPYCRRHATTVLTQIVKDYVDSGQVRVVMREYPITTIHPRAVAASTAALCAGEQGKYWEMHDQIFANQKALSDEDLLSHSNSIGLDQAAFQTCQADDATAKQIQAEIAEAQSMGISGTPSFVIGLTDAKDSNKVRVTRYIRGAQPLTAFQSAINDQLKLASQGK